MTSDTNGFLRTLFQILDNLRDNLGPVAVILLGVTILAGLAGLFWMLMHRHSPGTREVIEHYLKRH